MPTENDTPQQSGTQALPPFSLSRFLKNLFIVLTVLVVTGGTYVIYHHQKRTQDIVVHIGYLPIYVDLPLFVAYQQGYFREHGVHVQLDRFASSPELGTALATKNVSAAASIAYATLLSSESRDPNKLKIFMVDGENKDNYLSSIVVLPASGINSIEALRNKHVGSFPGPQAVTFFKLILRKHGLEPGRDVDITEIQSGTHISALQSHTVDALFTYEPIATQAVQEIGAVKLIPGAVEREVINPWQAGVWVLSADFIDKHPEDARAIIAAIYEAVDFIRTNPTAAKNALNDWTSIPPKVAEATPTIPFTRIGEVDLAVFQRHADILQENGIISKKMVASGLLISPELLSERGH